MISGENFVNKEHCSLECQEMLEILWKAREKGADTSIKGIDPRNHGINVKEAAESCINAGTMVDSPEGLKFTEKGEEEARTLIRRHRLAEVLMVNVFSLPREPGEQAACTFEHILTPEVTEHICIFLGHPRLCPDGKPIPKGKCCEMQISKMAPMIVPLSELKSGDVCRIVFIETTVHERLGRLASYGITPGGRIKLHQRRPSFVLRSENTDIAIDDEVARSIFVRKLPLEESEGLR